MSFLIGDVTVSTWSKDPLYRVSDSDKSKLRMAIQYSRQIVDDSLIMLKDYLRKRNSPTAPSGRNNPFADSEQAGVNEAIAKYFGLSDTSPTFNTDLQVITMKYQQIKNGISGPFELVVGAIHDFDDVKTGVKDAAQALRGGSVKDAVKQLQFIRKGTEGWVHGGHAQKRIHLNKNSVKTETASKVARIIVHEASHKFAATIDVAYKHDNLKNNAGAHANLTNNADSYAWGGRLMWKRKRMINGDY